MPTILDVSYRPPKRTVGAIVFSWLIISIVAFFVIDTIQQMNDFTGTISRLVSTLIITGCVTLMIFFIKMSEQK